VDLAFKLNNPSLYAAHAGKYPVADMPLGITRKVPRFVVSESAVAA
jgi:hypothetical protein